MTSHLLVLTSVASERRSAVNAWQGDAVFTGARGAVGENVLAAYIGSAP